MEKWRQVWRDGIAPQLPLNGLRALLTALVEDDSGLIQGANCYPPIIEQFRPFQVNQACAISYCGWKDQCDTVGKVEEFFNKTCIASDDQFTEPAACRYFINWYDDAPREIMRCELIPEVKLAIKSHEEKGGG